MSHTIKDANNVNQTFKSTLDGGESVPHVRVDNLPANPATEAKQDTGNTALANILAKLIATPATEAKQDAGNTALANILAKIISAPSTEAKQDAIITALGTLLTDAQLRAAPVPINLPSCTEVAGPAGQTAINVDLLTGNVNGWYDARAFQSGSVQIVGSAGISAGQIIFEQTNDNTNTVGIPLLASEVSVVNANPQNAAFSIAASANRIFRFGVNASYVRVRISTAFTGGSVRAFASFSDFPYSAPIVNVQQATAGNLNGTMAISGTPTVNPGNTQNTTSWLVTTRPESTATGALSKLRVIAAASVNNTLVKGSAGRVYRIFAFNLSASVKFLKLYNKATAPVAGTDTPVETYALAPNVMTPIDFGQIGDSFATGIGLALTGSIADSDTTVLVANDVVLMVHFL